MPKYIAFLRAINVGGHTVKMDVLRQLFESLGLSKVETFIASGNVIFDSPSKRPKTLEAKIEKHLHETLGYEVATFLRTPAELAAVAGYKPFSTDDLAGTNSLYIGFTSQEPSNDAKQKLQTFADGVNDFHINNREVYWLVRKTTSSQSDFSGARLEKTLGLKTTMRNRTTVKKLADKYPPAL
jgi:uncharacterized protein (DUF1697 family)